MRQDDDARWWRCLKGFQVRAAQLQRIQNSLPKFHSNIVASHSFNDETQEGVVGVGVTKLFARRARGFHNDDVPQCFRLAPHLVRLNLPAPRGSNLILLKFPGRYSTLMTQDLSNRCRRSVRDLGNELIIFRIFLNGDVIQHGIVQIDLAFVDEL
jgi:hypothetical protein